MTTPGVPKSDDVQILLRLSDEILRAICAHDAEGLSAMLAEEFVLLSGAERQSRTAFLEAIRTADFKALDARFESIGVEVIGEQAVVTGTQCVEVEVGLERVVSRGVFMDLFVRRGGTWRLRVAASTDLP